MWGTVTELKNETERNIHIAIGSKGGEYRKIKVLGNGETHKLKFRPNDTYASYSVAIDPCPAEDPGQKIRLSSEDLENCKKVTFYMDSDLNLKHKTEPRL